MGNEPTVDRARFSISVSAATVSAAVVASQAASGGVTSERSFFRESELAENVSSFADWHKFELPNKSVSAKIKRTIGPAKEWNAESERRFEELAEKYVDESITALEQAELDELQRLRANEFSPKSFKEVEHEMEVDHLLADAVSSLERLVSKVKRDYGLPAPPEETS